MSLILERRSITLSSGAWNANSPRFDGYMLRQIFVDPVTVPNTYDFSLTNAQGDVVFERTSVTNVLNEYDVGMPLVGTYTMAIANATVVGDTVVVIIAGDKAI